MNVLLISYPYLPGLGGVERSVHNLAHFLADRGHRVVVVTHQEKGVPFSLEKEGAVRVVRLRIPSPFGRGLRQRAQTRLRDALNLVFLLTLCRVLSIEIIHCHLINVDTRYGAFLARRTKARLLISLRGGETEHWIEGRPNRREYVARLLEEADRITAVSQSLLDQAGELSAGAPAKGEVIRNPIDLERLRGIVGDSRGSGQGRYILFSGRLEPMKDIGCLIDAYHCVVRARPHFSLRLVIAGDGSLREELLRQAADGEGRQGIEFLGRVDYAENLRLTDNAAMVVLPSANSEGCPNTVLEAMAFETPVIVSSLPSLTEMVENGGAGLIFPIGDSKALSECIIELADDAGPARKMAAAARRVIAARHGPDAILTRIEQIYQQLSAR